MKNNKVPAWKSDEYVDFLAKNKPKYSDLSDKKREEFSCIEEAERYLISIAKKEIDHLKKTGIPRCQICHKDFKKVSNYEWKPTCGCFNKEIRLCMG